MFNTFSLRILDFRHLMVMIEAIDLNRQIIRIQGQ